MKLIAAFLRLVRWPNLLFIILSQLLFYYFVYQALFTGDHNFRLVWLIVASVFIAAGGYIINDYFDLNIDLVNKPRKNVINSIISRRWAILWHLFLSFAGIGATLVAVGTGKWYLVAANMVVVVLLWFYSTSFKRKLLIGNIVISLLTAWSILIMFFATVPFESAFGNSDPHMIKLFRVSFLYGGFAFIISMIREVVKDMEDMEGDRRYGCKTLPIVAGLVATRIYTLVWIVVLLAALTVLQLYVLQFGWWWAVCYATLFVIMPLFYLFRMAGLARTVSDFAHLSRTTKWIMLAGILSMVFFRLYI